MHSTLKFLDRLIGYPTVSSDSNLDLIDYVVDVVERAGARTIITTDDTATKANLLATFGPEGDGGVVLSGHTDVVPVEGQDWSCDPFTLVVDEDRAWGRGTTDMKGYLACVLAQVAPLSQMDLSRPVHFAFTYDEEVGLLGGQVLLADLEERPFQPALAMVGEPTLMRVVTAHKGGYEFTTRFTAGERHSSMGTYGAGAISAAGRFIGLLDSVAEELLENAPSGSRFDPVGSTINIGTIRGGVARNITPREVVLEWELRPAQSDDPAYVTDRVSRFVEEELVPHMRRVFPEATVETTSRGEIDGLYGDDDGEAARLLLEVTDSDTTEAVSYCTEAGLFDAAGISAVVCGPGSIEQAHKPDEYIELSQLEQCLDVLQRLIQRQAV